MNRDDSTPSLVQKAYGEVARKRASCCGPAASCCGKAAYAVSDNPVPESELGLSCGNPLAFGHINKGDVVLDLGSGAGKDQLRMSALAKTYRYLDDSELSAAPPKQGGAR